MLTRVDALEASVTSVASVLKNSVSSGLSREQQ